MKLCPYFILVYWWVCVCVCGGGGGGSLNKGELNHDKYKFL